MSRAKCIKCGSALVLKLAAVLALVFGFGIGAARAQSQFITENFDNINTLPASGWFTKNNSMPWRDSARTENKYERIFLSFENTFA